MALHQTVKLLLHVPELPNFRDVHADAAECTADVADDASTVFDHEADVERHVDFIFGLQFQHSRRNEAWHARKLAFAARQFTDVAEHRHGGGPAASSRTDQDVVAIALAARGAAALAGEAYSVGRAVNEIGRASCRDR